ncbi:hypothetical protein BUH_2349 [Burkholderia pseudomallei Pakistan 9]|nr:hypothetical protein BUH_2349 [Burkholderia pseudomallei Pakistan 9]
MRAAALVYPKNAPVRHRAIRFRHFSRRREPANDSRVASSIARMTHANSFSNAPPRIVPGKPSARAVAHAFIPIARDSEKFKPPNGSHPYTHDRLIRAAVRGACGIARCRRRRMRSRRHGARLRKPCRNAPAAARERSS